MLRYILLFILSFFTASSFCTIKNVPSQFSTIQAAIDASVNGDTILVAPGTYKENLNLKGKKIMLTSNFLFDNDVNTILATSIDGGYPVDPNFASCVMMVSGEDSNTVLQGFTLTNGKGTKWIDEHGAGTYREGGGILITLSSPVIRNNYIIGNQAVNKTGMASAGGGGIRVGDGNPVIENNVIAHNKGLYGAGIVFNYTGGIIRNNIIAQNEGGDDFGGGGIWIYNLSNKSYPIIIENNTIVGNVSLLTGGGIRIWSTTATVKNNIIWGNSAGSVLTAGMDASAVSAKATYNLIQGGWTGTGNINSDPLFQPGEQLLLSDKSPAVDTGDPAAQYNDPGDAANPGKAKEPSRGTIRNDIGAYGGAASRLMPGVVFSTKLFFSQASLGFKQIPAGDSTTSKIELSNNSQIPAGIDSLTVMGQNNISVVHYPAIINSWGRDSLVVAWKPQKSGVFIDTIKVYHNDSTQNNPFILKLTGRAKTPTSVNNSDMPLESGLLQNYPNPFNPSTVITFTLAEPGNVNLSIFNSLGEKVTTLINSFTAAGRHQIEFTAGDLTSGIYFYKLEAGTYSAVKKLILMR